MIDLTMDLLDQADDVAHAEHPGRHALGIEWLQGLGLLTDAHEYDRLAGDIPHRKRRTTASITVSLGENHAGQIERRTEGSRGVHGILARHGVDDEQALRRVHGGIDLLHLVHEALVDVQASGGIDDEHVEHAALRLLESVASDFRGRIRRAGWEKLRTDLLRESLQLQDRGGSPHVRAHEQDAFFFTLNQPACKLGSSGRFTCALQTCQQYDDRGLSAQIEAGPRRRPSARRALYGESR